MSGSELSFDTLVALLGRWWWPFVRIAATLWLMPLFGDARVAAPMRIALAFLLSLIVAPLLPPMPAIDPFSLAALAIAGEQVVFGILLALCLQLLIMVMSLMGQILSAQMGLSMAVMNDPVNGDSAPLLAEIMVFLGLLLFLGFNGHLVALDVLVESFRAWPPGAGIYQLNIALVAQLCGWAFGAALLLALPAIVAMLLVNLTFGVMARSAPALNVFALGFPMSLMLGWVAVLLSFNGIATRYLDFSGYVLAQMRALSA